MPPQPTLDHQTSEEWYESREERIKAARSEPQFSSLWTEIRDELQRALTAFPPFNSGHEGWAVIMEECDELWEAVRMKQTVSVSFPSYTGRPDEMIINRDRVRKMRKEAIQVAAMAIRFLLEMDQFKN